MNERDRFDPGSLLIQHRAPPGTLQRALALGPRSRHAPIGAVLACAASLLIGLWLGRVGAPQGPASTEAAPVSVQLVFSDPQARHVTVAGSFNGWDPSAAPMRRTEDGLFQLDLTLARGRHEYMFVVDGERWVTDRLAAIHTADDFGNVNAVLEI